MPQDLTPFDPSTQDATPPTRRLYFGRGTDAKAKVIHLAKAKADLKAKAKAARTAALRAKAARARQAKTTPTPQAKATATHTRHVRATPPHGPLSARRRPGVQRRRPRNGHRPSSRSVGPSMLIPATISWSCCCWRPMW